jgi:hypothetical protein
MAPRKKRQPAPLTGERRQSRQVRQSIRRVMKDTAEEAARRTIEATFTMLGQDITKPEGVQRLQKIFTFAGDMTDARDTIKKQSLRTAVGLIITGAITLLALGLKDYIKVPAFALVGALAMTPTPAQALQYCVHVLGG